MTGDELKAAMQEKGWTIAAFARYLHRSPSTVKNWRRGLTPVPRYVTLLLEKGTHADAEE